MRDILEIQEQGGAGRMVHLVCNNPFEPPTVSTSSEQDLYYQQNMVIKRKNAEYMPERHNPHLFLIVHCIISH